MTNEERLMSSIARQAILDYFDILSGFKSETPTCNKKELEEFFKSDWFSAISTLKPIYLMQQIKKRSQTMVRINDVAYDETTKLFYVVPVGTPIPISKGFTAVKQAAREAARLQNLSYAFYRKVCARDAVQPITITLPIDYEYTI